MSSKRGPKMQSPKHEDVAQFVRQSSCPFVTTKDVSEQFGSVSRRTIWNRLEDLEQRGKLEKREIGANSTVWYTPD